MEKILTFFIDLLTIIGMVLFWLFGAGFILALPVMWCWNYVIPKVSGLQQINYFEAFCLHLLCGFLFNQTKKIKDEKKT